MEISFQPAKAPFWRCIQEIVDTGFTMLHKDTLPDPKAETADIKADLDSLQVQLDQAKKFLADPSFEIVNQG